MEHAELVDAPPLPVCPRLVDGRGWCFGVALEHGDGVAVLREQHRGGLARHSTSDDENLRHRVLLPARVAVGQVTISLVCTTALIVV